MPQISLVMHRCLCTYRCMLTIPTSKGKQYLHSNVVATSYWGFASAPGPIIGQYIMVYFGSEPIKPFLSTHLHIRTIRNSTYTQATVQPVHRVFIYCSACYVPTSIHSLDHPHTITSLLPRTPRIHVLSACCGSA